jgi:hypothetical protein
VRRRACAFSVTRSLLTAAAAALVFSGASSASESTIYPGVGIGKVKLGMTRAQVEHVLGKDAIVNSQATFAGTRYVELGWNFATWTVAFAVTGPTAQAVQIGTTLRSEKTSARVGLGTLWRPLVRAYPHGLCAFGNSLDLPTSGSGSFGKMGYYLEYLVPHKGGTQTIFVLQTVVSKRTQRATNNRVFEVHVRKAFAPLEEFAPDSRSRCAPGWENTNLPHS